MTIPAEAPAGLDFTASVVSSAAEHAVDAARIPTLHVVADCIPRAFYRALRAVWDHGHAIRTEYDRRDAAGAFIDPPSRDARVLIEVTDPFAEPRYPAVSHCEIGKYLAEIMGVKDHWVLPLETLKAARGGGELEAHEWPYTYHQRLFAHPLEGGGALDQMALALEKLAQAPHTRRAVASTALPGVDPFLREDIPCLREVQLRLPEDGNGGFSLHMNTMWRSRDLFKAWPDNVVGLTFLQGALAQRLGEMMGRPVRAGSYADYCSSLHIYGQDFARVGGDAGRGLQSIFDTFDEDSFVARSLTSDVALEMLVLPQMRELLEPAQVEQWRFGPEQIALLESLIADLESGHLMP